MSRLKSFVLIGIASAAVLGCSGKYGPSINTPIKPAPREIDELSVDERRSLLDRAQVFRPIDTKGLDLLAGPRGKDGFPFDANVTCAFAYPDEPLSGATPKFECEVGPKDVVKVKYGAQNGEVYAEVAASRLFWALGFFADRMYPVRITCVGCPGDPHRASTTEWRLGKPGKVGTMLIEPATIERKFEGESIEVPKFEGWSWLELEAVADNSVGATRAHIDALKLLAAFIQHVDSKPENQGLVCADEAVTEDRQGNESCSRPVLVVKDLGSSFAQASRVRFPKMKLASWRGVKVWRDEKACQANLTSSIVGTLSHPRVSEAGRRFLAARLSLLSDKQLLDLFTAARVERHAEKANGRPVTAADWVQVFKAKRDQIVNHRCAT
jgi:hypothetical protein